MNEKKDSNPKDVLGIKKVPLHAIPVKPLLEVGLAMMEGGRKYGTHNYREIGVCMSTYYNAAMRHLMSWWEGEDIDPASGVHHVVKALASLFVVRDGMHMGNCVDDRPIRYPNGIDIEKFNEIAADLITKYPKCAKPFTYHQSVLAEPEPETYVPQPGDMVFIELREDSGYYGLYDAVEKYNHVGKIIKKADIVPDGLNLYTTTIGQKEFNLYPDELTLLTRKER